MGMKQYLVLPLILAGVMILGWQFVAPNPPNGGLELPPPVNTKGTGATGSLFEMRVVREFDKRMLKRRNFDREAIQQFKNRHGGCKKWTVITTINPPSNTVKQVSSLQGGWCAVIVLDQGKPANPRDFKVEIESLGKEGNVVVLTTEDQEALPFRLTKSVPWRHFGRKNIGYLYAIAMGAEVIYDTDDDNELISPESPPPLGFRANEELVSFDRHPIFNPYPAMGVPGAWPRGIPLEEIKNSSANGRVGGRAGVDWLKLSTGQRSQVMIHQSLANHDPDVDAIYRLTKKIPFNFPIPSPGGLAISPAVGVMTPYNAQATTHFRPAHWGLLLPVTVHGRVSDIWRGYFTLRLMWDIGGRMVFRWPWVVQYRNEHNYVADMEVEWHLYMRAGPLTEWLTNSWDSDEDRLRDRIFQLWVDMYRREIIEFRDVQMVHDWLSDLTDIGYKFPKVDRKGWKPPGK